MAFQDIEKGIKKENINSRFRLSHIVGQRVRELCEPTEETLPLQVEDNYKITTNVLDEVLQDKIVYKLIEDE
jgi:DNA-directed RNA polymerase subunit K/omega